MATGMLTLEDLKKEVAAGTIDTVVAAMVDLQGRLVGKRFHAQYFIDSGCGETHACNYLLASISKWSRCRATRRQAGNRAMAISR